MYIEYTSKRTNYSLALERLLAKGKIDPAESSQQQKLLVGSNLLARLNSTNIMGLRGIRLRITGLLRTG